MYHCQTLKHRVRLMCIFKIEKAKHLFCKGIMANCAPSPLRVTQHVSVLLTLPLYTVSSIQQLATDHQSPPNVPMSYLNGKYLYI